MDFMTFYDFAWQAVQLEGGVLRHVPRELLLRPEYEEIARLAVRQDPPALQYVPRAVRWFVDLAEEVTRSQKPEALLTANVLFVHNDDLALYIRLLGQAHDYARYLLNDAEIRNRAIAAELADVRAEVQQGWIGNSEFVPDAPTELEERLRDLDDDLTASSNYLADRETAYAALGEEYQFMVNP